MRSMKKSTNRQRYSTRRDSVRSGEHLRAAPAVKFRFIHEHRQEFPIVRMCQMLEVSEKGYANWRKRGKSQRKRDDEIIMARIEDAYYQHRGHYGSPRIHAELKEQGISCGRRRVARLMQENQLSGRQEEAKSTMQNWGCVAKRKLICQNGEKRRKRGPVMAEPHPFKWRHFQAEIILLC